MIVRILSEGQYELDDAKAAELDTLDEGLNAAIEAADEPTYRRLLSELIDKVRTEGAVVDPAHIVPSDLDAAARGLEPARGARAAVVRRRRGVLTFVARSRFPADRGLTARMMTTVFLLGLLYAVFVTALARRGSPSSG